MEFLFIIGVIWFLVWLLQTITAAGDKSQSGTPQAHNLRQLQVRVESKTEPKANLAYWSIQMIGPLGLPAPADVAVQTSILDVTDSVPFPVLSALEQFQESGSRAFSSVVSIGHCRPGDGLIKWVQLGAAPKDLLMFPYPGTRKIRFECRIIDAKAPPLLQYGQLLSELNVYTTVSQTIKHKVERGYLAKNEEELGIAAASIRLAYGVAFADGVFDVAEGKTIKAWAKKFVKEVPEGKGQEDAQEYINTAIRTALGDAQNGQLSIAPQVQILNTLADDPEKYAAMELCLDVMAADGIADRKEMQVIDNLCKELSLDVDQFRRLREKRLIKVDQEEVESTDIWERLSIPQDYSNGEKEDQLKKLYRLWNSRSESLSDPVEREKANKMLHLIAEARRTLGG